MSKPPKDNRERVEKKLFLALECPEPLFDLSACEMTEIPTSAFPLCQVLRKEALYLDKNYLTDLTSGGSLLDLRYIKVLNISSNRFRKLPSTIYELESLEVFDASNNQITDLPDTFGGLRKLLSLNLSYNHLKCLPASIGNCKNLEVINLKFNEQLKELPVTIGKLDNLRELDIDSSITYPPKYICSQGTTGIVKYLSNEMREDSALPSTSLHKLNISPSHYDELQGKIEIYEKLKKVRQSERMLLEKQIQDHNQREVEMHKKSKDEKKKLLEDVQSHQRSLEAELDRLQKKKADERAFLIQLCLEEERKLNDNVKKITTMKKGVQLQFTKEWENERKAEEEMLYSLATSSKTVEKDAILKSMEKLMAAEVLRAQETSNKQKIQTAKSVASVISKEDELRSKILKQRAEEIEKLLDKLRENEELQKSAVACLLQKSDERYWELSRQIKMIEDQLAELTRLELAKKQLELNRNIDDLAKSRESLAEALMDLLEIQKTRRKQLVDSMNKMEMMRETTKNAEMFWLQQYDKMLQLKSHEMISFFESYLPMLKDIVLDEDAMKKLNQDGLKKCGIYVSDDRSKILRAIKSYLEAENKPTNSATSVLEDPAALLTDTPAAYVVPNECVVCLEARPCVVFVPCGHLCCCYKCFTSLNICPLCRSPIKRFHKKGDCF